MLQASTAMIEPRRRRRRMPGRIPARSFLSCSLSRKFAADSTRVDDSATPLAVYHYISQSPHAARQIRRKHTRQIQRAAPHERYLTIDQDYFNFAFANAGIFVFIAFSNISSESPVEVAFHDAVNEICRWRFLKNRAMLQGESPPFLAAIARYYRFGSVRASGRWLRSHKRLFHAISLAISCSQHFSPLLEKDYHAAICHHQYLHFDKVFIMTFPHTPMKLFRQDVLFLPTIIASRRLMRARERAFAFLRP